MGDYLIVGVHSDGMYYMYLKLYIKFYYYETRIK